MFPDQAIGAFRSRLIPAMKNMEVVPLLELAPAINGTLHP
jgi:hypothetical protein